MCVDFLLERWADNRDAPALAWKDRIYTYGDLYNRFSYWKEELNAQHVPTGAVVVLEADFSLTSIALFIALADRRCFLVPLTGSSRSKKIEFTSIAQGEILITVNEDDSIQITSLNTVADHDLYRKLRDIRHPGLVLFSSGSTGKSKGAVHDLLRLMEKFKVRRHTFRTLTFLLYDHIGGVNTLLDTLSNAGCLITVRARTPDAVLDTVEKHQVELLPTSPTFINLIMLSEAYKRHNISSLKIITYGTEPMPESTLRRFHALFPAIKLQQTYGLSEVGILSSKSRSSDSLWVKIGGPGFETRIVDGILQIKAASAMLGYLNSPSPYTEDGWLNTEDVVELDGEYLKILGRESEIINVGGEKVYPAEVESVLQELDSVAEVAVYGEQSLITGSMVCARVVPAFNLDQSQRKEFIGSIKNYCRGKLQKYKVPVRVSVVTEIQYTDSFKKTRR